MKSRIIALFLSGLLYAIPSFAQQTFFDLCSSASASEVRKALDDGADVSEPGELEFDPGNVIKATPIFFAAYHNHDPEVFDVLAQFGANVNESGERNRTPLMLASIKNTLGVVEKLISMGADVHSVRDDNWTVLIYAAGRNSNPEVITTLIKAGASVTDRDKDGWSPLMRAASRNPNTEVITTLLQAGSSITERTQDGLSPFMLAACNNPNPEVITALLQAGSSITERTQGGWSPLMLAASYNPTQRLSPCSLKQGHR